jgi:hypothetical protein
MKIIEVNDEKYEVIREVSMDNTETIEKIKLTYEELFNAITLINHKPANTTLFCRKIEDGEIDETKEIVDKKTNS